MTLWELVLNARPKKADVLGAIKFLAATFVLLIVCDQIYVRVDFRSLWRLWGHLLFLLLSLFLSVVMWRRARSRFRVSKLAAASLSSAVIAVGLIWSALNGQGKWMSYGTADLYWAAAVVVGLGALSLAAISIVRRLFIATVRVTVRTMDEERRSR